MFPSAHRFDDVAIWLVVISAMCHSVLIAADRAATDDFERRIRPLLVEHCQACHGPEKQEGGLRLDFRDGWLKGGDRGSAIVPGDSEKSLVIRAVRYSDPDLQMPPQRKLGDEDIDVLEKWVASGASDPRTVPARSAKYAVADPRTFWSFQTVQPVTPPASHLVQGVSSPVDAFILAQLEAKGLSPAPRADARTLVRRAYFDLVGLPPTPTQVDALVSDDSPDAWSKLIDRLLESKQYGERWARHWLDVARYADSGGFETDIYYRNAWRYRDYVVKSFNDDKPYNVFVQEQIAGDELWPDDLVLNGNYTISPEKLRHLEALTGTGLYAFGPQVHESNMDGKKIRYETLADWVDTTGSAFLGLTVGCARCHDHKFDPISQRDYYALQAIFAQSKEVEFPVIDAMGVADFKQHYPRIIAVEEARRAIRLFDARVAGRAMSPTEQADRQKLLEGLAASVLAVPEKTALGIPFVGLMEIPTISVLGHERPELLTPIHLLNRGELSRPREQVSAALPEALRQASRWDETVDPTSRRKSLAFWLTSLSHPLTARVMVNRIWNGHFGRGIVGSLNDFGQMGERPSHPELLDWLAGEFVRQGWSIKQMHRMLMLSSTYQRDSRWQNERNHQLDPSNHQLWKMNRRRLEAEALWDAIHAVAGTLNLKMGGHPVLPPLNGDEGPPGNWIVSTDPTEHTRRGLYILQRRNFRFPMFDVFDLPVNSVSAPSREVTSVAPQALWLMNNSTVLRQATALVARLTGQSGTSWNEPDFGAGQSGWAGDKSGVHAGWAKRIDNGPFSKILDAPAGVVVTHGLTSVVWQVPANNIGPVTIQGGLWNVRHLGRAGTWKLWKNKTVLTEGRIDDTSGTSSRPMEYFKGTGGESALRIESLPGDLFRLEILEDDFVGVQLRFASPNGPADMSTDFSLEANPTTSGWQYCEALVHGGAPLTQAIRVQAENRLETIVEQLWRVGLGRLPSVEEKAEAMQLLITLAPENPSSALTQLCLAIFNLQEFSYVD